MLSETTWLSVDGFSAGLSKSHHTCPQEALMRIELLTKATFFILLNIERKSFGVFLKLSNCLCDPSDKKMFFSGAKTFLSLPKIELKVFRLLLRIFRRFCQNCFRGVHRKVMEKVKCIEETFFFNSGL